MSKSTLSGVCRAAMEALTLVSAGPAPPGPERALHEVLDRLGPSVFAGLLDPDGVLRYANRAAFAGL